MNALAPELPLIPETAPFTGAQRAWLNGFLAGLYGKTDSSAMSAVSAAEAEEFPWHDPSLALEERLALAEGKPLPRRLMAAMAQLDCGQCGYLCQTYSEALADGRETSTSLCVPGAKVTSQALKRLLAGSQTVTAAPPSPLPTEAALHEVRVVSAVRLTGPGSDKDVRHVVIDLAGSGLTYVAGDSLSLAAPADPELVAECLSALAATGDEAVRCPDGVMRPLREALTCRIDIARPLDRTLDLLATSATDAREAAMLRRLSAGEDGVEPEDADLLDLLQHFPSARPPVEALAGSLPALKPRLYSIASSPTAVPGQVHLCVSVVRTQRRERVRNGIASTFLADRAVSHGAMAASVTTSPFRLPADPAAPVIMVGPGTGIAPFRGFLQEREAAVSRGRAWLFFGDQHAASDFLFRAELEAWLGNGTLTRLDTAFSRDQAEKVYVQDRMVAAAAEIWRWMQESGYFYVCGDATRMARDVDMALRGIARSEGGLSETEARAWVSELARQGRYQRDVY